jgi:hypothetical protein
MWYSGEKVLPGERLIGAALRLMGDADGVVDQKEADNRRGKVTADTTVVVNWERDQQAQS